MAGTIDQLNFEIILNDKKFEDIVKKDLDLAQQLNTNLTAILNLKARISTAATKESVSAERVAEATAKRALQEQKVQTEIQKTALQQQKVATEAERTRIEHEKTVGAVKSVNTALSSTSSILRVVSQLTGVYFGVAGIRRFVSSMIEITGQFELQKVALKTILKDAEGAEVIFEQLYRFSSDSMYRFSELAKHAKQLAAFGIGQDSLLETTKMLGDVAAGLGISMDKIILAYGHVKSSGFLRGIQLRSFSQNGVPILDELAKILTEVEGRAVSLGEVFDRMTKRQIDFAMVEEAFRRMTEEGGQFHNIQEQMARTLAGEINVLKGRWENLMYAMGEKTEGFVLTVVRAISESISSLEKFEDSLTKLWEAGSPLWTLIIELRSAISEARALKGKGGSTSPEGGAGSAGGGVGGGARGDGTGEQQEVYLRIADIINTIKTEEAEIYRLRKKAKGEGLSTGLVGGTDETQLLQNAIDSRDEALKQYKQIMGVDYYRERKSGSNEAERARKERIRDLKSEADFIKKLADAYAKLEPYLGAKTNDKMVEIFGEGDYSRENLEESISDIVTVLRELGKEGNDAADSIEQAWGLDKVTKAVAQLKKDKKAAEDAQKSLDKYLDALQKWADKNQELSGTGAAYGISKAISTYRKALGDSDRQAKGLLKDLLFGTASNEERSAGFANINAQWARSRANAFVTLRNDISKFADDIFKEQMKGYDLSNWNDKTLSQILAIKRAIASMEVPKEIKDILKDYPELLALLEEELTKLKQEEIDKTVDPERFKKIASYAKKAAGYFMDAASAMKDLADATGNKALSDAAEAFGAIVQNLQAAADGAEAWGGWWGAIIGGVTDIFTQVSGALADSIRKANDLAETIRIIKDDAWIISNTELFANNSIFGENKMKDVRGAAEAIRNIRNDMESLGNPDITRMMSFWDSVSVGWRIMFNPGHIAQEEFLKQGALTEVMQKYGLNMYDKYGNFDPASVRKVIEMFGDESGVLERLAKDADAYAAAMKSVEDVMNDLFGDVASSAADKIVDSWVNAGNAALDYADILDDVARSYAKMLVESAILDKVLNQEEADRVADMFINGRVDDAMAAIATDMEKIASMEPLFDQILTAFDPYFLRDDASSGSGSLGSGIKGITEDTANLLASYINAIRADVSFMRSLQEGGWAAVTEFGRSLPTLNDHIAQIAATNFDIARSNQSILSELQSVIGAPGTSGMVVRVEGA